MKLKFILATAALALVSAASVNAAGVSYTTGDFFLGIRSSDSTYTTDLLVDLGQGFDFTQNISFTISGSLKTDIAAQFGSDWYGRSDVLYSIISANNLTSVAYASNPSTDDSVWNNSTSLGTVKSNVASMAASTYKGKASTANCTVAVLQNTSDTYSYYDMSPDGGNGNGISFGYFDPSIETTTNSTLSLDRITQGNNNAGTNLGTLALDDNANLTFTAVPEPSTYALLIGAFGVLGLMRRRFVA